MNPSAKLEVVFLRYSNKAISKRSKYGTLSSANFSFINIIDSNIFKLNIIFADEKGTWEMADGHS